MLLSLLILVNIIVIIIFRLDRSYYLCEDVKSINEELEDLKQAHCKTRTFYQI